MKHKLVIRSLEAGPKCIIHPIHLKTTDTMEESSTEALVDTGATRDFINQDFITRAKLPTHKLSQPIPVYNVDGTSNEAGSIHKVVDVIMTYNQNSERILLAVTQLGKQSMILGFTWLDKHNLEIDFKAERSAKKEDTARINTCRMGPFPAFVEDADKEEDV